MNYREDRYGNRLSALGYGCMRFTTKMGKPDIDKAEKEIMTAYQQGVNYFDTAYIYPGSEALLGEVLEKNRIREKVYIATKLPHYLIKNEADFERIFQEELKRLRTDYIDYYFMHMLSDTEAWERLCLLGIEAWITRKKETGQIRQIGFSYHGNSEMFCKLVDCYSWDFCMIQYNYLDENSQAGKRGLRYANQKQLPVMIMEPLRGGRLANRLPKEARRIFSEYEKQYSPAQWAFRWLWNQPEVTVVLSGMNSIEMVLENTKTASEAQVGDLTEEDFQMLEQVVTVINRNIKIGCTGCGYCVPCPKNVDIPGVFSAYNRRYTEGKFHGLKDYFMCTSLRKNYTGASLCIGCGKCEKHCPQGLPIRQTLQTVTKEMEGPVYQVAKAFSRRFTKF